MLVAVLLAQGGGVVGQDDEWYSGDDYDLDYFYFQGANATRPRTTAPLPAGRRGPDDAEGVEGRVGGLDPSLWTGS